MTKVNTKKTGKKHGSKESSFNIMPFMMLILFLFVWFGFKFITESSTINLNRRNDAVYENKLIQDNYPYLEDIKYKKDILSSLKKYSLKDLEFLMGPLELEHYITLYNNDWSNYAYGRYNPPEKTYLKEKKLRANLNIHSTLSDGEASIKSILEQAAEYANALEKEYPGQKYIIAITDINTTGQCKHIIDEIVENPDKYKNLRVVFGVEIYTTLEYNDMVKETAPVNILALCINPFSEDIKREFDSYGLLKTYDMVEFSYDKIITLLNNHPYTIYGISRPLQYIDNIKNKPEYIESLLKYYGKNNKGFKFVEAYYDPYIYSSSYYNEMVKMNADKMNFYKIGSLEQIGESIFSEM